MAALVFIRKILNYRRSWCWHKTTLLDVGILLREQLVPIKTSTLPTAALLLVD